MALICQRCGARFSFEEDMRKCPYADRWKFWLGGLHYWKRIRQAPPEVKHGMD